MILVRELGLEKYNNAFKQNICLLIMKDLVERINSLPEPHEIAKERVGRRADEYSDLFRTHFSKIIEELKKNGSLYISNIICRGPEYCKRCGEEVNSGIVRITNPDSEEIEIPYIAMHTLDKHNSRFYFGNIHRGIFPIRKMNSWLKKYNLKN